jgi:hypothetical protein
MENPSVLDIEQGYKRLVGGPSAKIDESRTLPINSD